MVVRVLNKETKSDVRAATQGVLNKIYRVAGEEVFRTLSQAEYDIVKEFIR